MSDYCPSVLHGTADHTCLCIRDRGRNGWADHTIHICSCGHKWEDHS